MKNSGIALSKLPRGLQDQVAALLHRGRNESAKTTNGISDHDRLLGAPTYPFTIWLDYQVPSLNTLLGKNWRVLIPIKRLARDSLALALMKHGAHPTAPAGRMHVILTSYVITPRDSDNPCPKFLIDAVRRCGLLRDDDPQSMALTYNPEVRVHTEAAEGTRLTIVEALP